MKKLFVMFILLTPLAIADERAEIFISPSYGSYRGQKKNDFNQEVKNVIGRAELKFHLKEDSHLLMIPEQELEQG